MIEHFYACSCGEVIMKSQGDTTKIRNKTIVFRGQRAYAICKGCGKEHPIPIVLDQDLMKSFASNPSLFVRKVSNLPRR